MLGKKRFTTKKKLKTHIHTDAIKSKRFVFSFPKWIWIDTNKTKCVKSILETFSARLSWLFPLFIYVRVNIEVRNSHRNRRIQSKLWCTFHFCCWNVELRLLLCVIYCEVSEKKTRDQLCNSSGVKVPRTVKNRNVHCVKTTRKPAVESKQREMNEKRLVWWQRLRKIPIHPIKWTMIVQMWTCLLKFMRS